MATKGIIFSIIGALILILCLVFYALNFFPNIKNNSANLNYPTAISVQQNQPPAQVRMLVFGDLMLDRYIRQTINKHSVDYLFQNIKQSFLGNDLILANLEGGFTDFLPHKAAPNMVSFTFDPKLIPQIKELGFNIFSLANNHTRDFGSTGFNQTKNYLAKNSIEYFGDYSNNEKISAVENINGIKIGFIGYNALINSGIDQIVAEIKKIQAETDFTVVFVHWGNEYQNGFSANQQAMGWQFIDAGADIVIGSHPHVVEPIEIYKDKPIFYSLGNFVFDQVFSEQVQQSLSLAMVLQKNTIEIAINPLQNKNFVVSYADDDAKIKRLKNLAQQSIAPAVFKQQIADGRLVINN